MKEKTQIITKISPALTADRIWLWLILAGLPLAVHNGYFDITETKTLWFGVFTAVWLLARGVCAVQFSEKPFRFPRDPAALGAVGLCAAALLASLASGFFAQSLIGRTGRYQGALMLWLYALMFLTLPGTDLRPRDLFAPLLTGMGLAAVLTVLNHLGADPLGMSKRLAAMDQGRYISTLGNIDFAGAYFTLTLPTAARLLLCAEKGSRRIWYGALSVLGLWAAMAVRSESALLGLGTAAVLLPSTLKNCPGALRRWGLLPPRIVLAMHIYRLMAVAVGARLSALTNLLLHPALSGLLSLFGIGWYLMARRREEERIPGLLKPYGTLLLVVLTLGIAALILLNTALRDLPLGSLESWLRFSDEWGTDRGKVWKYCLRLYGQFPLPDKLLGGGCGILALLDSTRRIFPDAILDTAHCEYLQILLNWGALGLTCYLVWIGDTLRRALRSGRDLPLTLAAGALGYAFNALSNIAQAPGIMLFFVLLAGIRATAGQEGAKNARSADN